MANKIIIDSPINWEQIKEEFEQGETIYYLEKKYNVPYNTLKYQSQNGFPACEKIKAKAQKAANKAKHQIKKSVKKVRRLSPRPHADKKTLDYVVKEAHAGQALVTSYINNKDFIKAKEHALHNISRLNRHLNRLLRKPAMSAKELLSLARANHIITEMALIMAMEFPSGEPADTKVDIVINAPPVEVKDVPFS